MQKSVAGTIRSQNAQNTNTKTRQQRTATTNRTGGNLSSGHGSSAHKIIERQKPKVFDENSCDVTPKPMMEVEVAQKIRHGSALFHSIEGTSTPTDIISNGSILNTNAILTGAQSFGAFPDNSTTHVSNDSNQHPNDSGLQDGIIEKEKETSALFITNIEAETAAHKKSGPKIEKINLSETSTYVLLNLISTCLSKEDENAEKIMKNNEKYIELCKSKVGNDSYAERAINTFNDRPKLKSTQTDRITINEKGVDCSLWDMYDSFNGLIDPIGQYQDTKLNPISENEVTSKIGGVDHSLKFRGASAGIKSVTASESSAVALNLLTETTKPPKEILINYAENENFKANAFYMERLLNQNTYQPKQARYRCLEPLASPNNDDKPAKISQLSQYEGISIEKLWTYQCTLTQGRNISCTTWNKKNPDLLAAGYGRFEFNEEQSGLVCCWSLKNPEFPERYYKTEAGVTSLAFSQKNANLLAVGLFNGNILVFDVRVNNTEPLLSTNESENKHLSPVWHLKWTDRDRASSSGDEEHELEVIMSVSSDGRVTQWMIRKGFESLDYLKLKKVTKSNANSNKKEKNDGFICRHSGGLCFDVWSQDKSIYLCGTEEGHIHRCSTSYNEQYLDTYQGHTGPVYKLSWSPFLKNCFLSASGDWTLRLWKVDRLSPCLTFNSSSKAVYDICWSNHSATLFCCVNETAIELWDLSKSTLDPIYVSSPVNATKLTSISYSPDSQSLIVGTNDGQLWTYAIKNSPPPTTQHELEDLIKQSLISQLETVKLDDDEAKETLEKHQLVSMNQNQQEIQENKSKMDAVEMNIDKMKQQNEDVLQGKAVHTKKKKKKKLPNGEEVLTDEKEEEISKI